MTAQAQLLLCDAPTYALEDLLPLLRDAGYGCTYVQDASDLRLGDVDPHAVLVHAGLPGGAQGETFGRLRRAFPGIPILVVAPLRSLSIAIEFFRAGASDYLAIPLKAQELYSRIEQAIASQASKRADEPEEVEAELTCEADGGSGSAVEQAGPDVDEQPYLAGRLGLEALACAVWVCDSDGQLIDANAAALSLLGQSSLADLAASLRRPLAAWEPRDRRGHSLPAEAWPPHQAAKSKAPRAATMSLRRPDGTRVWVRLEAMPSLHNGRLDLLTVVLLNTTEECAEIQRLRRRG